MSNRVIPFGQINPNATIAPGVVVQESINQLLVTGVNTNLVGAVGTAIWGPVGSPVSVSSPSAFVQAFGVAQTVKHDMGTFVNAAALQGATASYVCVRVTDGTDTAAVGLIKDNQMVGQTGAVLHGFYTGALGNHLQVTITAGSLANTYNVTIGLPGVLTESFNNVPVSNGIYTNFWQNLVAVINMGQSSLRGPSHLVTAMLTEGVASTAITAPGTGYTSATVSASGGGGQGFAGTVTLSGGAVTGINITNRGYGYATAPTLMISGDGTGATATATISFTTSPPSTANNPYTFSGGTNGYTVASNGYDTNITSANLIGTSTAPRTGMYGLLNTNVNVFALVDNDDSTTFATEDAFAALNACQAVLTGPAGETVANAISTKSGAGISDNNVIYLRGNWCYFMDTANNGVVRLISPQGFYAGLMGNLSPELSPLNKQLVGIVNTQSSYANQVISDADTVSLMENGIESLEFPAPAGNIFAALTGKSGGTNLSDNNVNIQRMANFLGVSLSKSGVLGAYIGQLQTPAARRSARNALSAFLTNLNSLGQIEAFRVVLDATNNPNSRVVLGFMTAQVTVQLFSVIIVFLIDLTVGTVTIQ